MIKYRLPAVLPALLPILHAVLVPVLHADAPLWQVAPAAGPPLSVGETRVFDGGGLKVTFVKVAADTRRYPAARPLARNRPERPVSGTMRQRVVGNAVVVLSLEAGNQAPRIVRLSTHRQPGYAVIAAQDFPPGVVGIPKSYVVTLRKLLPDTSKRGGLRPQRTYRLRLAVDVAV